LDILVVVLILRIFSANKAYYPFISLKNDFSAIILKGKIHVFKLPLIKLFYYSI